MIKVIDNFLEDNIFNVIKNLVSNIQWSYIDHKVNPWDNHYQLIHTFYDNAKPNNSIELINPIVNKLNAQAIIRIKANLTFKSETIEQYNMHRDIDDCLNDQKTAIYYLNTNNGKTIFENGEEVSSVENRIVIFPGKLKHSGTTHTDTKYRLLINFNYF